MKGDAMSAITHDERLEAANNPKASRQWLSAKEAAEHTGLGFSTLAKLRLEGGGPSYSKIGAKIIYYKPDLDDWLKSKRVSNTSQYAA
jgi:predicted DNA-binding transcriptional regulator AlpA